jgi:hypothetical protein
MDITDEGRAIANAIAQGEAIAVSNGSFKDLYGTVAWGFEGANDTGQISGAVVVPGSAKDQSSYRSELAGIYSILAFAKRLCVLYKMTTGSIELGCNGQSALDKAIIM